MKVFAVFCNADMTGGRGPMRLHSLFQCKKHADEFIDQQPGVMGLRKKWSEQKYGDWEVKPMEVITHSVIEERRRIEELKRQAFLKLSPEEREALGLTKNTS